MVHYKLVCIDVVKAYVAVPADIIIYEYYFLAKIRYELIPAFRQIGDDQPVQLAALLFQGVFCIPELRVAYDE